MKEFPKLLISDARGKSFDVPFLQAAGMKAKRFFPLESSQLIKLPRDSELFMLPCRAAVGFDHETGKFLKVENNPFTGEKEPLYAVSAFLAPGYTTTFSAAYSDNKKTDILPLFSYAAVAFYKNEIYAAGVRVDKEKRQSLSGMDLKKVNKNVKVFRKIFPKNRLMRHLEGCALEYGCPAAKNFFLKRYEGPLPTSPVCNAKCIGCISYQEDKNCSVTQPRILFIPTPEEVAEVALFHISNVKDPVVSFGQGCEGEPLMMGDVLEKAIKLIRNKTSKGMINLNTNASKPFVLKRLFACGLDSIRVSMNSVQKEFYLKYYNPQNYAYSDVLKSIRLAKRHKKFVSVNYLVMPGFTDWKKEVKKLKSFIEKNSINMIQWRNLNYDPYRYFEKLGIEVPDRELIGIRALICQIKKRFPCLLHGYFNPSKGRIRKNRNKTGKRI